MMWRDGQADDRAATGTCLSATRAGAAIRPRTTRAGVARFGRAPFRQRRAGRRVPQRRHGLDGDRRAGASAADRRTAHVLAGVSGFAARRGTGCAPHRASISAPRITSGRVDGATARALFDEFLAAADQPSIDGFNTFTVCRLARRHDTKVVLSGLGGDELFGGYPSFRDVPRLATARATGAARRAGARGRGGAARRRRRRLAAAPARRFDGVAAGPRQRLRRVSRHLHPRRSAHADRALRRRERRDGDEPTVHGASDPTAEDAVSRLELTRYMRNQLLRDGDVMSMASRRGAARAVPRLGAVRRRCRGFPRTPAAAARQGAAAAGRAGNSRVGRRPAEARFHVADGAVARARLGRRRSATLDRAAGRSPMDTWYRKWSVLGLRALAATAERLNMAEPSGGRSEAGIGFAATSVSLLIALAVFPADPSPRGALTVPGADPVRRHPVRADRCAPFAARRGCCTPRTSSRSASCSGCCSI